MPHSNGTPAARHGDVIAHRHVRCGPQPVAVSPGPPNPHREPIVELFREGDVVTAIQVTCPCGETISLDCRYE